MTGLISLGCKEIKPVNPKGNQSWIFIGRTDAEAEAPKLWPPDMKSWLIGKDPDARKDRSQEEKGMTEDEVVGWHHELNGHESEQAPGDSEKQGSLLYCSPWGHKEWDMTEWLNNNLRMGCYWWNYCLYIEKRKKRNWSSFSLCHEMTQWKSSCL